MYETWKPIEGAINYEVSNFGRVRNIKTKNILNGAISKGYVRYDLSINGKRCVKAGHRLVAEAFLPQIAGKDFVNHKDGDKTNNNLANLEWCTCQENSQHAYTQLGVEPVNQKPVRCIGISRGCLKILVSLHFWLNKRMMNTIHSFSYI